MEFQYRLIGFAFLAGLASSACNDASSGTSLAEPCVDGMCPTGFECVMDYCLPFGLETSGSMGDGDGDTNTNTNGDGDGDGDGDTNGDGDADTGDGDGDGDPGADADQDGIPNLQDNCPTEFNLNQLDFDGNGLGNVCDVLEFNSASGTLLTNLDVQAAALICSPQLQLTVTGATVAISLDDNAAVAGFEITNIEFEDFATMCVDGFTLSFSFTNVSIVYAGSPFPVEMDHNLQDHSNGVIVGTSDGPHPMTLEADAEVSLADATPATSPIEFPGELASFDASITGAGSNGTLSWIAPNTQLTEVQVIQVQDPVPVDVEMSFRGLSGTLILSP